MYTITEDHLEELKEFTSLFCGHQRVDCVYEIIKRIWKDSSKKRREIIDELAKEEEISAAALYKWYNSYFNSGISRLLWKECVNNIDISERKCFMLLFTAIVSAAASSIELFCSGVTTGVGIYSIYRTGKKVKI